MEALESLEDYRLAIWKEVQQFRKDVRGMGSVGSSSRKSSMFEDAGAQNGDTESEGAEEENVGAGIRPVPLSGSEELVQAMEGLDIQGDEQGELVGENGDIHSVHRLAPLPEAEQAKNFEDDPQQLQEPQLTRTRKDSALGGRLLRSLSTISVHEVTGGDSQQLYSKAAVGQYILEKSAGDAPISERPKEFA